MKGEAVITKGDENIVKRIIINLLNNAMKYAADGGRVKIRAENTADKVKVSVIDTGLGIPEEFQEKIFDKYGQLENMRGGVRRGKGLGLTFCRLAVEAHGGNISVESDVGKGSSFIFTLPRPGLETLSK